MFTPKGRLEVTLLVVGLGMYAAFHALDAGGDGNAPIQRTITDTTVQRETKKTTKQVKCSACKTAW